MMSWEILWMLFAVGAVLFLCYHVSRFVAVRGGGALPGRADSGMQLISRLPLAQDKQLVVVSAGGRYWLLGLSQAGVQAIAELTADEADACRPAGGGVPPRFADLLRDSLTRKKGADDDAPQ